VEPPSFSFDSDESATYCAVVQSVLQNSRRRKPSVDALNSKKQIWLVLVRPVFRGGLHYAERRVLWRAFGGARSVEPRF
jgi:hypothetical protein